MKIFLDETGDPHPAGKSTCFAVGTLIVDDERNLEEALNVLANEVGDPDIEFHATEDSPQLRDRVWDAVSKSSASFDFKAVVFDVPRIPANATRDASGLHQRAVALALSLLPFSRPETLVQVSERTESLTAENIVDVWRLVKDMSWETILSIPELRQSEFETPPICVVPGTPSRCMQLCDHLLWRCQRAIRNSEDTIKMPANSLTFWRKPIPTLEHFQVISTMRLGSPFYGELVEYSESRPTLPRQYSDPFKDTYGALAHERESNWSDMDRELIRLLLNAPNTEAFSKASIAQLCYLILEGRTRWSYRFPMTQELFGLFSAVAAIHIADSQLDPESEVSSLDAVRFMFKAFRDEFRALVAANANAKSET